MSLGRTEGELNELRNRMVESTSETESSIIEVLELWQQIFRDTFQQYHRLSTRLVQSENRSSALNLWHDYLMHVQTFLSELPENYVCLNEYRNLCEIHQNVLTSQQAILSTRTNESVNVDLNFTEKFQQLLVLHSETLLRIIDRHAEIELRLKLWNKYRNDQSNLLTWLKEKEREKSRLQLRYIHIQRIPYMLRVIQNILGQMEHAQSECNDLKSQQVKLIIHDSAMITSMRMEVGAITQRIENLRASLETWRDFLHRIQSLTTSYNEKVDYLQSQFEQMQNCICTNLKAVPQNIVQIENTLTELRGQRVVINNLTSELEAITVIQEELKECLYPSNIKMIRRTTHGLWQQQADLDQELTQLIANIDERSTISETFNRKYERFIHWMDGIEHRINVCDNESCCILYDSEDLLRRFEKDVQSECKLREREKDWLLITGRELITFYATSTENDKSHRIEIKKKLDIVVDRWEQLKALSKMRSNKIQELKSTIARVEERITSLRTWLHNFDIKLNKPISFESSSTSAYEKTIQEHEDLQRSIEQESANIGEVLNLCEMVLSDVYTLKSRMDTNALSTAIETIDHRWKHICNALVERKQRIHMIWSLILESLSLTNELNSWVSNQENELNELEKDIDKLSKDQINQRIFVLENKIREIEQQQPHFVCLSQSYSKLVKCNGIDSLNINNLVNPCKELLSRYDKLVPQTLDIIGKLSEDTKEHQKFLNLHGKSLMTLTRIDADLTKTEHLSEIDLEEKLQSILILEHELKLCENDLASADELGLAIMQKSNQTDVDNVQYMIDEYQLLWKDIITRISVIKTKLKTTIAQNKQLEQKETHHRTETINQQVQVNTLPTLNRTTSITPKDAYLHELYAAQTECNDNLDALEKEINNSQRKPGSQVVQKLSSNCQSSVELLQHLSNILVIECFCTDEEAAVEDVANIAARYDALLITWKSKEQQIENRYLYILFFIFCSNLLNWFLECGVQYPLHGIFCFLKYK